MFRLASTREDGSIDSPRSRGGGCCGGCRVRCMRLRASFDRREFGGSLLVYLTIIAAALPAQLLMVPHLRMWNDEGDELLVAGQSERSYMLRASLHALFAVLPLLSCLMLLLLRSVSPGYLQTVPEIAAREERRREERIRKKQAQAEAERAVLSSGHGTAAQVAPAPVSALSDSKAALPAVPALIHPPPPSDAAFRISDDQDELSSDDEQDEAALVQPTQAASDAALQQKLASPTDASDSRRSPRAEDDEPQEGGLHELTLSPIPPAAASSASPHPPPPPPPPPAAPPAIPAPAVGLSSVQVPARSPVYSSANNGSHAAPPATAGHRLISFAADGADDEEEEELDLGALNLSYLSSAESTPNPSMSPIAAVAVPKGKWMLGRSKQQQMEDVKLQLSLATPKEKPDRRVPSALDAPLAAEAATQASSPPPPSRPSSTPLYCVRCDSARPAGYGHCSFCASCVAGFDHHCGILGVCVGAGNFRFFLGFLLASTLGLLALLAASAYWMALQRFWATGDEGSLVWSQWQVWMALLCVLGYSVLLPLPFVCCGLHTWLCLRGVTLRERAGKQALKGECSVRNLCVRPWDVACPTIAAPAAAAAAAASASAFSDASEAPARSCWRNAELDPNDSNTRPLKSQFVDAALARGSLGGLHSSHSAHPQQPYLDFRLPLSISLPLPKFSISTPKATTRAYQHVEAQALMEDEAV